MSHHYLIVDLETTNREPMRAEIIQGHFIFADDSLNILDEYELRVCPELWDKEADQAAEIHGISRAEASSYPSPRKAYRDLIAWLNNLPECSFVCHAKRSAFGKFYSYDYAVLNLMMLDHGWMFGFGEKFPRKKIISTHSLASHLGVGGKLDLKSLAHHYGLKSFQHHDAKADCVTCFELLKIMLPKIDLNEFFERENFNLGVSDDPKPRKAKKHTRKISGIATQDF